MTCQEIIPQCHGWIITFKNRSPLCPPLISFPIPARRRTVPWFTPGGMITRMIFFRKPHAILTSFLVPNWASVGVIVLNHESVSCNLILV